MRSLATLASVFVASVPLQACSMRGDQAGPNSSENKVSNPNMLEPVDETPRSSTPGAAPDNSQVEPRAPVSR
jgi:hypothetical protein